jgi:mono/diheme cytochrome c family protein
MGITGAFRSQRAGAVIAAVLLSIPAAWAEEKVPPSPEKGYELAQRFCQGCHLVDDKAGASVPAGVPTFRGIANRLGQTGEHIRNVLIKPHAPMPDIRLTGDEIQNILSYLETLRSDPRVPRLLPAPGSPKPKYPQPS